jgi:hypothetical protein
MWLGYVSPKVSTMANLVIGAIDPSIHTTPIINSVIVTPEMADPGTERHIVASVDGDLPLTYKLVIDGGAQISNETGVFDVVV